MIAEESERLARMVDDLLDLSKIQAGAVNPRTDWCDLRDVAQSAAAQVRDRYPEQPVELDLPGDLPLVQADAAQLERVFAQPARERRQVLAGRRAGQGQRRLRRRAGDRARHRPRARASRSRRQAQIFEPFFRGRQGEPGSGLGLAICRGLVEANGGRIDLQSDTGQGTSFAVSFPLVRQPVASG